MGVKGLWNLIRICGTPVTLESLENKILAVDVSIWLHQAVRGLGSASRSNSHLLTLFHRICKLLFYKIRPVFVFDGGVPQLKKQTISARRLKRETAANKAQKVRDRLLSNLLRSQAVRIALGKKGPIPNLHRVSKPVKKDKDLFELPPLTEPLKLNKLRPSTFLGNESEDDDYTLSMFEQKNIHTFEHDSKEFQSLPLQQQHEILYDLQKTRKENSWNSVNEMPQKSNSFSSFQLERLLKRKEFQEKLENIQSEIRSQHAAELEQQLFGELEKYVSQTQRIIGEDSAHSILVKTLKDEHSSLSGTLNQTIHDEKKKSLQKSEVKKDFLTELAKQGIVSYSSRETIKRTFDTTFSESSDDSSSEDESLSPIKRRKMEETVFLKVIDHVLDDNELTQEEIFSLIKQTQNEIEKESLNKTKNKSENKKPIVDFDQPSTSLNAPGIIYNSDAESSTDDEDFIDVTETTLPAIFEEDLDNVKESNKYSMKSSNETESNFHLTNNVDALLTTKHNSLYLKILQQKLDDILHKEQSLTKSLVDSRKISPSKPKHGEIQQSKAITIDLGFMKTPLKSFDDEIFKDIFELNKNNIEKHSSFNKGELNTTKHNILNSSSPSNNPGTSIEHEVAEIKSINMDVNISDQLKDKITELLKLEIEQMIKNVPVPQAMNMKSDLVSNDLISVDAHSVSSQDTKSMSESSDKEVVHMTDDNDKFNFSKNAKSSNEMEVQQNLSSGYNNENSFLANKDNPDAVNECNYANTLKVKTDLPPWVIPSTHSETKQISNNTEVNGVNNSEILKEAQESSLRLKDPSSELSSEVLKTGVSGLVEESKKSLLHNVGSPKVSSEQSKNMEPELVEKGKESSLSHTDISPQLSSEQLKHLESDLAEEQNKLIAQAESVERVAATMSDQIYSDAQELLKIFGLPYLVAPMEAESQCAFLEEVGLTHGTITDDSDILLFGGKTVYKDFFNHVKHVECFKVESILHNIGLDRNKMISLAMLTGSDYTVGIESVGAVMGMEILSEFPGTGIECLMNFKKWWNANCSSASIIQLSQTKQRLLPLYLPESFPNENIFKAYQYPEIDTSKEPFSWAFPNIDKLRTFAAEKFGWNRSKSDEIIIPVFKKLGIKQTQTHIDSYFSNIKLVKEPHTQSKRLQNAIARAKGEESEQNVNDTFKKMKVAHSKMLSKAPNKKTLLIDPSQGSYQETKKRKRENQNLSTIKNNHSSQAISDSVPEVFEKISVNKKEKKELIYEKLLEKEKIMQAELEKQEKNEKRASAALILKNIKQKKV